MDIRSKFTRSLKPLYYQGERVTDGDVELFVRTLSAAEYLKFCDAQDNITMLTLAVCDNEGLGVWTVEDRDFLGSNDTNGGLICHIVKECLNHCFGITEGGIESKQNAAAGN